MLLDRLQSRVQKGYRLIYFVPTQTHSLGDLMCVSRFLALSTLPNSPEVTPSELLMSQPTTRLRTLTRSQSTHTHTPQDNRSSRKESQAGRVRGGKQGCSACLWGGLVQAAAGRLGCWWGRSSQGLTCFPGTASAPWKNLGQCTWAVF